MECSECNHVTYYSFSDDAYYCPKCNLWFEEKGVKATRTEKVTNPDAEEEYILVLDFQATDEIFKDFKVYMGNLKDELLQKGYNILRYKVEIGLDEKVTSYKPYHLEIVLHSSHLQKEEFEDDYMDELFERFLETKGIILNHYSFKDIKEKVIA